MTTLGPTGLGNYRVYWSEAGPAFTPVQEPSDGLLVPGFVDIHIHGAFGVDFMTASTQEIVSAVDKLAEVGYELLLPTSVTAKPDAVKAFLAEVPNHPMVPGVHLEGPFISPTYPGAQPPDAIASPADLDDWHTILSDPTISVVTLAPELEGSMELIRRLSHRQVRVGIGHTNATYAEAKLGFEAGATHTTHTYNAMRPLHHREAGTVGFALLENLLATELIYDRVHVVREAAELLVRSKPAEKLVAVSDGTMASGLAEGTELTMWGLKVKVGKNDVRLLDGTLAGSKITLYDAFKNLAADFGIETAIRATSYNPRKLLGLSDQPKCWIEMTHEFEIKQIRKIA